MVFASWGASISTYTTTQGYPPSKALQSRTNLLTKVVLDNSRTPGLLTSEEAISSLTCSPLLFSYYTAYVRRSHFRTKDAMTASHDHRASHTRVSFDFELLKWLDISWLGSDVRRTFFKREFPSNLHEDMVEHGNIVADILWCSGSVDNRGSYWPLTENSRLLWNGVSILGLPSIPLSPWEWYGRLICRTPHVHCSCCARLVEAQSRQPRRLGRIVWDR